MAEDAEVAQRVHRIENLKQRYERGDSLYGADAIRVLLEEIAVLAERCIPPAGFNLYGDFDSDAVIWHRDCTEQHKVGDLPAAWYWARNHVCPPAPPEAYLG